MTEPSGLQLPPPTDWQQLERWTRDLFEAKWQTYATMHGRMGQPQHGVDVYGQPNGTSEWHGVQCKNHDTLVQRTLTEEELRKEVDKAKQFKPSLDYFIVAVTGPRDAKIQSLARDLTAEHQAHGLFTVQVLFWPDFVHLYDQHRDVFQQHYGDIIGYSVRALHQLPSAPLDFVGRKEELEELRPAIRQRGAIISCTGMGGVGKTALALVLAHEIKDHYPDGQIFLDLKGTTAPLAASAAMAHVVQSFLPEAKPPENEAALQGLYHEVLHGKRVLLLMDNAASRDQVAPLVPPETGVLLVTTRQHFALEGLYSKDLDVLPPKDARKLLLEICRRIGDAAERIAELCGRLPLALRAAASLLATTPSLKPQEYAARLADERTRLERIGAEGVDIGVGASFGLSFDALSPEAKGVFCRLSVFPAFFDAEAEEVVCEDEDHAVLSDLMRRSLVEFNAASDRYRLHDLVRLFAAAKLEDADRAAAEGRHAEHYEKVLRVADNVYKQGGESVMRGLAKFDLEWQNIKAGQGWAVAQAGEDERAARLCSAYPDVGAYLLDLRQYPRERIGWRKSAVAAARKLKDRAVEGRHLGNLGAAYAVLGETRRAIEFYQQRLEIAREVGDKRGEGNALGNLGVAYAALGETRRAIEFYEQTLAIDREIGDRRGEGQDLGNLGLAYADLGETRRAIEYHEKALEIDREIGDRRGEGQDLWNMSLALRELERHEEAAHRAEEALGIFEQIEDPNAEGVRRALETWRNET